VTYILERPVKGRRMKTSFKITIFLVEYLMKFEYSRLGCDSSPILLHNYMKNAYLTSPNPEFILLGGDLVRHKETDEKEGLKRMKEVMKTIHKYWGEDIVVLPVMGNDDFIPAYHIEGVVADGCIEGAGGDHLKAVWKEVFPHLPSSFGCAGFYSTPTPIANLSILAINTIPFSTMHSPPSFELSDPSSQLSWLDSQLTSIPTGHRVIILGHISPSLRFWNVDRVETSWFTKYSRQYYSILKKHSWKATAQIFGFERWLFFSSYLFVCLFQGIFIGLSTGSPAPHLHYSSWGWWSIFYEC